LHILTLVREDAIRLFGFFSKQEKNLFDLLLGISRIGPKMALNILSGMELGRLKKAILTEDILALASIPGLGRKSAERIIFEIRGKKDILEMISESDGSDKDIRKKEMDEIISVLQNLGYKQQVAENAVKKVLSELEATEDLPLDKLIKSALKVLSGR
jgi:Holliday junction DNA helicase RuvA